MDQDKLIEQIFNSKVNWSFLGFFFYLSVFTQFSFFKIWSTALTFDCFSIQPTHNVKHFQFSALLGDNLAEYITNIHVDLNMKNFCCFLMDTLNLTAVLCRIWPLTLHFVYVFQWLPDITRLHRLYLRRSGEYTYVWRAYLRIRKVALLFSEDCCKYVSHLRRGSSGYFEGQANHFFSCFSTSRDDNVAVSAVILGRATS